MWALVHGLPFEAATWRDERREAEAWTTQHELLAGLIEQQDRWMHALVLAVRGVKHIQIPGAMQIPRPGEDPKPTGRIVTDPGEIAAFFRRHS